MNGWLVLQIVLGIFAFAVLIPKLYARLLLSRAKHPSLGGHPRIALFLSRFVPPVRYDDDRAFSADGAPREIVDRRERAIDRLAAAARERSPKTIEATEALEGSVSDLAFVNAYRVPFQYADAVRRRLPIGAIAAKSEGHRLIDLDGHASIDLGGSYGVNLFGTELYKRCIDRGVERARDLGLVLGPYHPLIVDNVKRLREISGLDEVSFHMSGTEAVMQAVRLARYHTGRSHVVRFTGAYHGWSDGIQAGVGNPRPVREIYTLREMDELTLEVLRTRNDVACVLVNAIQAMSPNGAPPSDSTLLASDRRASFDKEAYGRWLRQLRDVCTLRNIPLIFDEVFLGFRLARGGVQELFGVRADLVTYGKTLGGGLPVGVLCGRRKFMRRFDEQRPADFCFARGTFNSHPYVMAAMNELLVALDGPEIAATYEGLEERWNGRAARLNARLEAAGVPVRVANMVSVWTTLYSRPSRYNWMFQYYLRDHGLSPAWIGSGRFIFSHDLDDRAFDEIADRFVAAAKAMEADGWWWKDGSLTNESIKQAIARELLLARLWPWGAPSRPARPASDAAPSCGTT